MIETSHVIYWETMHTQTHLISFTLFLDSPSTGKNVEHLNWDFRLQEANKNQLTQMSAYCKIREHTKMEPYKIFDASMPPFRKYWKMIRPNKERILP